MHVGHLILGLAICVAGCSKSGTAQITPPPIKDELRYELTAAFPNDAPNRLSVKLQFIGDADGETGFRIGGRWGNDINAARRFRNVDIQGNGVEPLTKDDKSAHFYAKHEPGAVLTVTYDLSQEDMRDAGTDLDYFYAPVLTDEVIHLIGSTSLITPVTDNPERIFNVSFDWSNLPAGWETVDTLPEKQVPPRDVRTMVLAAAPAQSIMRASQDEALTVLMVGKHDFTRSEFDSQMREVFNGLNRLWGDNESEYLVTLLGTPEQYGSQSATGTGRYNSFAAAATPGFELESLTHFLAHEVAHQWMPGQLGNWPRCELKNKDDCPPKISWFSEGFTDFVMTRAMLAEGYWDRKDLVAFTNEYLADYHISPARNATGKDIDALFWQDFEHERQPYWRGFLIAMNWDAETKYVTKGSASVMSELKKMHEAANKAGEDRPILTSEYIAMQFSLNRNRIDDINRYYNKGETININPDLFPDCATLTEAPVYGYDVGFDPELTLSTGVVSGVNPEHEAAKAGLKNGQAFVAKISGGGGDTTVPLVLEVKDGENTKTISYMPIGGAPIMVPQFEITGPCVDVLPGIKHRYE